MWIVGHSRQKSSAIKKAPGSREEGVQALAKGLAASPTRTGPFMLTQAHTSRGVHVLDDDLRKRKVFSQLVHNIVKKLGPDAAHTDKT